MTEQQILDVVRDQLDAFNNDQWARWRELHTPNAEYDEVGTGRRLTGHDEILEVLKSWKTAFPDLKGTVDHIFASENVGVVEMSWKGTHKGTLTLPVGTVPPTNTRHTIRGVMVCEVSRNKITKARHYFDALELMSKLGAIPEMKARKAKA